MTQDKKNAGNGLIDRVREGLDNIVAEASSPVGELHWITEKEHIRGIAVRLVKDFEFVLLQLAAVDERTTNGGFGLYYTFAHDQESLLVAIYIKVEEVHPVFPSITPDVPAAQWYEREIRDMFGLNPIGHPDIRPLSVHEDWPQEVYPLRRDFPADTIVPRVQGKDSMKIIHGEGVMEIPVGPIHAGIIEPGHFRFSAVGENVINLQARLFYTHRGMEKLTEERTPEQGLLVAERICGACSFSHSTAYCQAVEKLARVKLPERAAWLRTLGLELERLYNHIGDVGNICAGVGFAFGTMHLTRLKEEMLQLNEAVFGSRFLRGINIPGGVRRDIDEKRKSLLRKKLASVKQEFEEIIHIMLTSESYLDRAKVTGTLERQIAVDLHAVGPAARASGVDRDARRDFPYAAYDQVNFRVALETKGDVLARVQVRIQETDEAFGIIEQVLNRMPQGEILISLGQMVPGEYAASITESPRGENVHFVMAGNEGKIYRHMVRSASYCNWPVLPLTVPGNIVPDFPLINKSFELCYSCLDR